MSWEQRFDNFNRRKYTNLSKGGILMEKEYMELKQFTASVVDIYLELAKLEKQEKKKVKNMKIWFLYYQKLWKLKKENI